MATGIRLNGVDTDDLFDPDVMGDGPSAPALNVNGVPLKYAAIGYGVKRADVGLQQNSSDVANLWAQKGSATYTLPFHGHSFDAHSLAPTDAAGTADAGVSLTLQANGDYTVIRIGNFGSGPATLEVGRWLPVGQSAGEYEVMMSASNAGAATISNNAPGFSPFNIARGVGGTISVPADSAQILEADVTLNVDMRRNGVVMRSSITANISAAGWR